MYLCCKRRLSCVLASEEILFLRMVLLNRGIHHLIADKLADCIGGDGFCKRRTKGSERAEKSVLGLARVVRCEGCERGSHISSSDHHKEKGKRTDFSQRSFSSLEKSPLRPLYLARLRRRASCHIILNEASARAQEVDVFQGSCKVKGYNTSRSGPRFWKVHRLSSREQLA